MPRRRPRRTERARHYCRATKFERRAYGVTLLQELAERSVRSIHKADELAQRVCEFVNAAGFQPETSCWTRANIRRPVPCGIQIEHLKVTFPGSPSCDRHVERWIRLPFKAGRHLLYSRAGVHEFTYPLSQLICLVNRTDTPLSKLLKQGYTVRASFEFRGTAVMRGHMCITS